MPKVRILNEGWIDVFSQLQDPSRRQEHKHRALDAANSRADDSNCH